MAKRFLPRQRLSCPGPTPVPPQVQQGLAEFELYHRDKKFFRMLKECQQLLQPFFGTTTEPLILTSSGTGAMEAAITNLTMSQDSVLVVNGGKFGERWEQLAQVYQCRPSCLRLSWGHAPTEAEFSEFIRANASAKVIFLQACESSTGVKMPLELYGPILKKLAPDCLVVVDGISAMVAQAIKMDDWGLDCVIGGSQKGFGVPPGLAFIALSTRAWKRLSQRPRFYFDLDRERDQQSQGATAWTPAVTLLQGLQRSLTTLAEVGVEDLVQHHHRLAAACRKGAEALGLQLLAPHSPCSSLTAICLPQEINGNELLQELQGHFGLTLAGGQGRLKGKIVRIAHLGYSDEIDLIGTFAAFEIALRRQGLRLPLGAGTQAMMNFLA